MDARIKRRARSCVGEQRRSFRPDGPKVFMCSTDRLHHDNLFVTDVQMEDGGDQAEVKTCFSEGGGWGWWWWWLWMVQWGCAAIRQRFGSRGDCTCPMSPFGIALRLRAASVAEMDELVRRVRDDAVRPAAGNLLPYSSSLHTPTLSWRETRGSKRIWKAAFRGGCRRLRAHRCGGRRTPTVRDIRACARFITNAASSWARSFISLLAVVARTFPSWKNDIILTGIEAPADLAGLCVSKVHFISEDYQPLHGTVAPSDKRADRPTDRQANIVNIWGTISKCV